LIHPELGKTAIGLSYFFHDKKQVAEIPRALDPLYKQFDYIIAIDGRYINYEHELDYSIEEADNALRKYPNLIMEKVKPMFQPEKRQRYLDIAGELGIKWLIVWDADDIIWPEPKWQNWKKFWKHLRLTSERFSEYRIFKMRCWIPSLNVWRRAYNVVSENTWVPYIRIHKNPGEQRYCLDCHYWFAPKDASDEDLILQKRGMYVADQTINGVRFTTNSALRGETQLYKRDRWAWNNDNEEKRRSYIKAMALRYWDDKTRPDWMSLELEGYWRYDDLGRPTTKIVNEDGSKPKRIVYYNSNSNK